MIPKDENGFPLYYPCCQHCQCRPKGAGHVESCYVAWCQEGNTQRK